MRRRAAKAGWLPLAVLLALLQAGCAGLQRGQAPSAPHFAEPGLTVAAAAQALSPGRSTRAEVQARLGAAETLRFASGYEVWVYRARGLREPRAAPELVLLFNPAGVLQQLRARPGYPPAPAQ